jgi:truncated hemoglobin YjbI
MNLLDQLGGSEQLVPLIELHNKKVLSDERLSPFFVSVDMTALSHKQKAFLQLAFSEAPIDWQRHLNAAHSRLRTMGLTDDHVDAVLESFAESLTEFGASPEQVQATIAKLEVWRDAVMDRASD